MAVTYTFTNGTVADADEVNTNFTDNTTAIALHLRYIDSVPADDSTSPSAIITIPANTIINGLKITFDYDFGVSAGSRDGYVKGEFNVLADTNATPTTVIRTINPAINGPGSNTRYWGRQQATSTTLIETLTTTSINYVMLTWSIADSSDGTGSITVSNIIVESY